MKAEKTKIQIMSIYGEVLFEHESVDNTLKETVEKAVEDGASLDGANLYGANLDGASLDRASLARAKFSEPIYLSDLYSLKQLPKDTILTYWKYIKDGKSPIQNSNKIKYEVGKTYTEKDCNDNEYENCGAGLNVATIFWCLKETVNDNDVELIECQFKVSDIVAIPYWTDGKFRVSKLKVIRKISRAEAIKELQDLTGLS